MDFIFFKDAPQNHLNILFLHQIVPIMQPQILLFFILGILIFDFILERILNFLNMKAMKPELPKSLGEIYNEEKYRKSQEYTRENARLGLISSSISFGIMFALLFSGSFGALDTWIKSQFDSLFLQTAAFFGIIGIASEIIGIPFSLYNHFVIEEKYGFNKMTIGTWLMDKIKGYVLGGLIGGGILWIFIWIATEYQNEFWWMFWVAMIAFMFLANVLYVPLILPLFNKLKPLEKEELKVAIENYAQKVGFPGTKISVMDGSKRSTKANAFFSGFGKTKRVVLFDTLVNEYPASALVAVLAHEVGHYKKGHILSGFGASILQTGVMLFLLSLVLFSPEMSFALGGKDTSIALNLMAFGMLFSPLSLLIGTGMNLLSRKNEYEADEFARTTSDGNGLADALIKLHADSLSNLTPHPAYVFFHYSHPTLLQKLERLRK